MNRTLKYALSAALSAMIIVPAFAQDDNFPDVQPTHWAYKDLGEMKKEGLLVGYPGTPPGSPNLYLGNRPASRYELAVATHAVWANLKAMMDQYKSQIDDLNAKMANAATKDEVNALRAALDALKADVDQLKNVDIPRINRLLDEFKGLLDKMGADVAQMKADMAAMSKDVKWLMQHALPFDVSGDANFWMGSAYSQNTAGGGFGITVDGRPTGVKRDGSGDPGGGIQDLTILDELGLTMTSNNSSGPTWKATLVAGNMMANDFFLGTGFAFGNQSRVAPGTPFSEANMSWYFQQFSVNFDTSIMGLGFNAELGRVGFKVSPYMFQRPDNTPYFSNERWDNGNWMFDGGVLGFHFGGANLKVFGGRNSARFGTGFNELQPMFAGADGVPFSPGTTDRPRGFVRNMDFGPGGGSGLMIDQSLGLNLSVPLSNTGALNLAYMWLDSNASITVPSRALTVNRVNVYGGDLKFNFSNLDVEAGWSKSDVMSNSTAVINRDNNAWYAMLGYAASNWGIKGGYRRIDPQYAAPGDWGRIGIWWNPTDIQGAMADFHFDLNSNLRLMANAGFYTGTGTTINGVTGLGTDDHLNHWSAGFGYKMGGSHNLMLGFEGVQWDLKDRPGVLFTGGKPTEQWFNIGWGVDLSARTKFNLMWQVSNYDSKGVSGMGPFGFGPGGAAGQTKGRGGLITTTLSVRF